MTRQRAAAAAGIFMAIAFGATGPARAEPVVFDIDPSHTSVQFAVKHLVVSTVRGTLGRVSGELRFDESAPVDSTVEATIDVAGIDTRDAKRDEHLRAPDFLDAATHPTITFKSKSAKRLADGKFTVTGDLTLKGVTKEVVLDVEGATRPITDPFGNVKLGGVARTRINRQDFGVAWSKMLDGGGLVVGDEVDVVVDIEFTRRR